MESNAFLSNVIRVFASSVRTLAILPGVLSLICPLHLLAAAVTDTSQPVAADCCGGGVVADEAAPPVTVPVAKSAPPPAATEFFKGSDARVRPHGGRISLRNLDLSRPPEE